MQRSLSSTNVLLYHHRHSLSKLAGFLCVMLSPSSCYLLASMLYYKFPSWYATLALPCVCVCVCMCCDSHIYMYRKVCSVSNTYDSQPHDTRLLSSSQERASERERERANFFHVSLPRTRHSGSDLRERVKERKIVEILLSHYCREKNNSFLFSPVIFPDKCMTQGNISPGEYNVYDVHYSFKILTKGRGQLVFFILAATVQKKSRAKQHFKLMKWEWDRKERGETEEKEK